MEEANSVCWKNGNVCKFVLWHCRPEMLFGQLNFAGISSHDDTETDNVNVAKVLYASSPTDETYLSSLF